MLSNQLNIVSLMAINLTQLGNVHIVSLVAIRRTQLGNVQRSLVTNV